MIDPKNITFLILCILAYVVDPKKTSNDVLKAAKQLLEKEQPSSDVCKVSTNDVISKLRLIEQVDEALTCLLKRLNKDPLQSWHWSQLGAVYAIKGSKSKAKTCFKQAAKLSGKVTSVSQWEVLAPFVIGKPELDGDPLEMSGGIRAAFKERFNKKQVFFSELASGGKISWKTYEQNVNQPVQVSPQINWGDLINSLGSLAITEWQGWAVGEFSVNTEKEEVAVQCLGVPAVYVDEHLLAGDVYKRETFWSSVTLQQGIHSVYVRLRAKATQIFQCKLKSIVKDILIHEPNKKPDLVEGRLISDHLPIAVPVTNLKSSNWLTKIRFKIPDNSAGLILDEDSQEMSIAPSQTAAIHFFVSQKEGSIPDCKDFNLKVTMTYSGGSDNFPVPFRCRRRHESFLMTFVDHDGSIQEAAVIEPLGDCDYAECRVVLSLHGTGVAAQNQADSYKRMIDSEWVFGVEHAWVLAPTRHGAHNWEGPGSLTAITALKKLHEYSHGRRWPWPNGNKALPDEVIFAGHSMGGHGAWHLATHYPQLGKAVISMAGWNKKEEYGDSNKFFEFDVSSSHSDSALKSVLEMCFNENDVDRLVSNLKGLPVMVRIGAADRTVHPFFTRRMFRLLKEEGVNISYSELKDKEHWWWDTWDTNDGGVMNDPEVRRFLMDHTTSDRAASCSADKEDCRGSQASGVSSNHPDDYTLTVYNPVYEGYVRGVKIVQQIVPLRKSTIQMKRGKNGLQLSTRNVLTLSINLAEDDSVLLVDNSEIVISGLEVPFHICSESGSWRVCDASTMVRSYTQYGPARRVAEKPFLIVTGTQVKSRKEKLLQLSTYLSNQFVMTSDTLSRIVEDSKLLTEDVENQNLIIVGNKEENQWTETFLNRIPIKPLVNGFKLNNCNFSSSDAGVLSLAPNGNSHLALLLMGSTLQGLENIIQLATPTIPPMARSPFSNMIPDFVISGSKVRLHGPGGFECAGLWGNSWEFRQELASCVC